MESQTAEILDVENSGPISEAVYEFPVTFAQQRLWFLDRLQPGNTSYNIPWSIRMTGNLDAGALERALNEIVRRHEILRTTFSLRNGEPVQVVAARVALPVPVVDLSAYPDPEREARRLAAEEAIRPLDLEKGPLVAARLLRLGTADHVLLLTMHHIIFDGWSRRIFAEEMAALYEAFRDGDPSPLPEPHLQYPDYAVWQRQQLTEQKLEAELSYWKRQLDDAPATLSLPTDRPRPAIMTMAGAVKAFSLPKALVDRLHSLARECEATLFMTLLAGFKAVLARHSGQSEIVLGTPIANRDRLQLEGLIGFFANTLALRTSLDGDPTFRQLVSRTKETALGAFAHQEIPFEKLVEELRPERSLSFNPIFQVVFSLQNAPRGVFRLPGLELKPLGTAVTTSKFDLSLLLNETPEGLSGRFEYSTDLFDESTIARLVGHFQNLLEGAASNPEQRLSELPLLTWEERRRILVEFNDTATNDPGGLCMHDFVAEQAARTPHAVAIVCGDHRVTYEELNTKANRIAHFLRKRGAAPDVLVGIYTERNADMLAGILGILKSGSAYVPLDPNYPKERIANILEDARAPIVLTQQALIHDLPSFGGKTFCLDSDWAAISSESADNPVPVAKPENLGYVLFTSGSTGRPKGVALEHRSAATFIHWALRAFTREQLAGVLFSTSVCFDLSVFEMFATLSSGGKLIVAPNALYLPTLPARDEVTLINTVPSAIAELVRLAGIPHTVKTVNLAGEALPDTLVERIYASTSVQKVFNLYGPTEDTTYSTYTLVRRGAPVTVGRPICNTQAYILDKHFNPVPIGVPGELYLAGAGLARGYFGRPDLTAERFVANPFDTGKSPQMYKTGDLCRWLPDGNIQYLGRMDFQVKLRGFRIELGEIESVLGQHPDVKECRVIVLKDAGGDDRLVAYFVPRNQVPAAAAELRKGIQSRLPDYMIPAVFVPISRFPLSPNGKVNLKELPAPISTEVVSADDPSDPTEIRLAAIWEKVLGTTHISSSDNFFDCGGHSLNAVRLLAEVENVFGAKLPLTSVFQGPTLAQMARLIREDVGKLPQQILFPIQAEGDRPPLFCVARPNVNALGYVFVSRKLGPNQPVYGLQATIRDLDLGPFTQAEYERTATEYIAAMRQIQPHGPYFLVGHCEGAHIAFEMVRQLEQQGEPIGMLAILDAWPQENTRNRPLFYLNLYMRQTRQFLHSSRREQMHRIRRKLFSWIPRKTFSADGADSGSGKSSYAASMKERYWPGRGYVAPKCKSPILLFRAAHQHFWRISDRYMAWRERTHAQVTLLEVPGQHFMILREPAVSIIAENIRRSIQTVVDLDMEENNELADQPEGCSV